MRERLAAQMQKSLHHYIDLDVLIQLCGGFDETANSQGAGLGPNGFQQLLGQLGTRQQFIDVLENWIWWQGNQRGIGLWQQLHNMLMVTETAGKRS